MEKIPFKAVDVSSTIEILQPVRIALMLPGLELKPYVDVVDFAPGVYKITPRKSEIPRKTWFELEVLESYLPKRKKRRYED